VYSGEGLPYYYLSFGKGQNTSLLSKQNHAGLISVNPNPFNYFTTVRFLVTEGSNIEISVSGINGKPVGTIVNGDYPEGVYQVTWNPGNKMGKPVENGIYLIRLSVDGIIVSNEKVVLIK
jgi:flagellar hook assembly protein FlgD